MKIKYLFLIFSTLLFSGYTIFSFAASDDTKTIEEAAMAEDLRLNFRHQNECAVPMTELQQELIDVQPEPDPLTFTLKVPVQLRNKSLATFEQCLYILNLAIAKGRSGGVENDNALCLQSIGDSTTKVSEIEALMTRLKSANLATEEGIKAAHDIIGFSPINVMQIVTEATMAAEVFCQQPGKK